MTVNWYKLTSSVEMVVKTLARHLLNLNLNFHMYIFKITRKSCCNHWTWENILKTEKNDWVLFHPCYLHGGIFITQTFLELENSFHRFYPLKMTVSNLFAFMSQPCIAKYLRKGIVNYFSQILHNRWDIKWISWKLNTLEVISLSLP